MYVLVNFDTLNFWPLKMEKFVLDDKDKAKSDESSGTADDSKVRSRKYE
jgi:hypothetical protein